VITCCCGARKALKCDVKEILGLMTQDAQRIEKCRAGNDLHNRPPLYPQLRGADIM
jgi:hypothetical protein